jgi:hypothetical protein
LYKRFVKYIKSGECCSTECLGCSFVQLRVFIIVSIVEDICSQAITTDERVLVFVVQDLQLLDLLKIRMTMVPSRAIRSYLKSFEAVG